MDVPPEIEALVKQHLGSRAIETQRKGGRGAWLVTPDNQASYILAGDLPQIIGTGDSNDIAQMYEMVEEFDPEKQVVVIFNFTDDLQFVGVIDAV